MQKLVIVKLPEGERTYMLLAEKHGQYATETVCDVPVAKRKEEKSSLFGKVNDRLGFPRLL